MQGLWELRGMLELEWLWYAEGRMLLKRLQSRMLLEHEWLEAEIGHVDLHHSIKHLRDAHATNDLLFESGHAATGPHAAPHEHDDYV